MKSSVLIIDDEISACTFIRLAIKAQYDVFVATDPLEGMRLVETQRIDVVLLDLKIGSISGLDILRKIKEVNSRIEVIMMTAFGSIQTSVDAMKLGAFTYLTKPLDMAELLVHIDQAIGVQHLRDEVSYLSSEIEGYQQKFEMVGNSAPLRAVYALVDKLKDLDTSVTITGESGTGKELVARAIHNLGKRKKERFVVINCAAIPENLLEEEFFGHKRGSFTGADTDKKGKFEVADKGTVFLDEIGDMPLPLQGKLLRVLQQKEFTPIGATDSHVVDIRIIAATNKDLQKLVDEGKFRADLFYRLNVMNISMPPLRERKEDIPHLCAFFVKRFAAEQNKVIDGIMPEALNALTGYSYPGNVRQLANIIEYAVILCSNEEIGLYDLPQDIISMRDDFKNIGNAEIGHILAGRNLKDVEKLVISATLKKNNGKREITANELGISVRGLLNKIVEYGLQ